MKDPLNTNLVSIEKSRMKVWEKSVLPYVFSRRANLLQQGLFWFAEHTLVGIMIGLSSLGFIGVAAWEANKDATGSVSIVEVVFKNEGSKTADSGSNKRTIDKKYTKGTFQPILVENKDQPLDKIISGSNDTKKSNLSK